MKLVHAPAPSAPKFRKLERFAITPAALAVSLLCVVAQPAFSQTAATADATNAAPADATSAGASDASGPVALERVIVTANKREQAAIDVPSSVGVVSGERLSLGGATQIQDYAAQVPGLAVIQVTRGQTSIVLRGISTGVNQATPSTATYIDEAPIGSVNSYASGGTITPDLDPADLRRVEVLKGPQGTLYGAGAVGGLFRFVTTPANLEHFSGTVSAGVNQVTDGGVGSNERISLNVPLVQGTLGLRVSAFNRNDAGYIDNPVNKQSDINTSTTRGGRIALDWRASDDLSVKFWALTQKMKADGYDNEEVVAPSLEPLTRPLERSTWIAEPQSNTLNVANTTIKARAGDFELVSSTTWQDTNVYTANDATRAQSAILGLLFGMPGLGAEALDHIQTRRWSQEFRARSSALNDTLDYDVGVFWTKEDSAWLVTSPSPFLVDTGTFLPLPPLANFLVQSKYEEYSLFGNTTYAITPKLSLMAGARLTQDHQHFDQDYAPSIVLPSEVSVVQSLSKQSSNWMLGARYMPDASTSLYARAATGHRPGGPSALPPGILAGGKSSFEPDSLTSYELGFKSDLLAGRASIEAALFTTDWKKVQIRTLAPTPTLSYIYFVNGGAAQSKGAEVTAVMVPVSGLTLRANAAYTDARLKGDVPAAGGLNGDPMPYTPKWSASLGADYKFSIAAAPSWVGLTVNYIGARQSDYSQRNTVTLPAYTTLNVNAGADIGAVRVSLYARNLSNEHGSNYAAPAGDQTTGLNPSGNPYVSSVIQPRTIGVDLGYRF